MITRRTLLEATTIPFIGLAARAQAAVGFPGSPPARSLFPCPADGSQAGVNPPGFAWWRAGGAASYRLVIQDSAGKLAYEAAGLEDPTHLPQRTLPPGEYSWDVEACDAGGQVRARRGIQKFSVPAGIPELPWEAPKAILARVPAEHPRYVFLKDELAKIRQTLTVGRKKAWEQLRNAAERALKVPLPKPPQYHTFDGPVRQRMGYTVYFREFRRHEPPGAGLPAFG